VSDPTTTPMAADVGVRTVVVGGLPLLVAGVPDRGPAAELLVTLAARGLRPLAGVTGVELPRGAEVGFVVDTTELRLVDVDDRALLRAPRSGLDAAWLDAAKRLKGTMTVVVRDLELDADSRPEQLVATVDAAGSEGRVLGAIVGLLEERPQLPLVFG
jgi:hypothetical protein